MLQTWLHYGLTNSQVALSWSLSSQPGRGHCVFLALPCYKSTGAMPSDDDGLAPTDGLCLGSGKPRRHDILDRPNKTHPGVFFTEAGLVRKLQDMSPHLYRGLSRKSSPGFPTYMGDDHCTAAVLMCARRS